MVVAIFAEGAHGRLGLCDPGVLYILDCVRSGDTVLFEHYVSFIPT